MSPRSSREFSILGRDERGISLIELIVAIALTAVISTLMVTIVVTVSRSFTRESHATTNSSSASIGMRELSRVIRSAAEVSLAGTPAGTPPANAIITAGAHEITLYSFIDADVTAPTPLTVRFSVGADGTLTETRWTSTASATVPGVGATAASTATSAWQFAAEPTSQRVITRGVISTGAAPLFRYYSAAGSEISLSATGALDASQLASVAAVKVTLVVEQSTSPRTSAVLENTIGLPNLGLSRVRSVP